MSAGSITARKAERIALGSGHIYCVEKTASVALAGTMTVAELLTFAKAQAVDGNILGRIKNGATLNYSGTRYTEKDDFGEVSKSTITDESASLSLGMVTFDATMLSKLIDTAQASLDDTTGDELLKIGGIANAKNKSYILIFVHEDAVDGDVIVAIEGKNTAALALAFAKGAGTMSNPQFEAIPVDNSGVSVFLATMGKGRQLKTYEAPSAGE